MMMESPHSELETGIIIQPNYKLLRVSTCKDRLSALPDSIIEHILSFLPIQDAFKTTFLSKRWHSLCTRVPVLRLSNSSDQQKIIRKFVRFVHKALENYPGNKVGKLDISFHYSNSFSSDVDDWIRFSIDRKVEELCVDFQQHHFIFENSDFRESHPYLLSQSIYSNSSLQILKTNCCNFKLSKSGFVSWTSLKVLSITSATLDNVTIKRILLGSPNLEYLSLSGFQGVDNIAVASSNFNLKALVINSWGRSISTMQISGPNIHYLCLSGVTENKVIELSNLSSLVELELGLSSPYSPYHYLEDTLVLHQLRRLLSKLHYVEKLTIMVMFRGVISTWKPCPLKCKILIVETRIYEWDFRRIVKLLQNSPHLEKLTINLKTWSLYEFDDETKYWESMKTDIKCDHLKIVTITGFEPISWCVRTRLKFFTLLVEFLLKNAAFLEKMVIYVESKETPKKVPDLSAVDRLITSFPRASTNVVVEFKTFVN